MTIEEKIEAFKKEVGKRTLTDEQQRIYKAFSANVSHNVKFAILDKYGNTIRFIMACNKTREGKLHILEKHYKGKIGNVTAMEILNFCDIIRYGEPIIINGNLKYTLHRRNKTYTLIVYLKKTNSGKNILKSFYSDLNTKK